MKKLWVIIKREYLTRVKKKSFLLTTILVPLLIVGFYIAMIFLATSQTGSSKKTIAVVDESGFFENKLRDPSSKSMTFVYPSGTLEEVKNSTKEKGYSGILYVPELNLYKVNDNIVYYTDNNLGLGPREELKDLIRNRIEDLRIEDKGLDNKLLESLRPNDFEWNSEGLFEKKKDNTAEEILSGMGFIMGFMLYFVLIFFGMMVMRGVKEEKTNRIVEVIVSSVKPFQLMFGKIIGISMVGVTQFFIWGVIMYIGQFAFSAFALTALNIDPAALQPNAPAAATADLSEMEQLMVALMNYKGYGKLIITFLFYFLGGYLIYASLFSAVGSAVEDENEAQQLVFPVMMPIIVSMVILTTLFNDPHNPIAVFGSIFPLTSPIVMPGRIPFDPPPWQIIASVVSLILGVIFFIWLSAKIFRIGILMYGKKVNLKELVKWLRY